MQPDTQGRGGRPLPPRTEAQRSRAEFVDRERRRAEREGRPFPPGEAFRRAPDNLTYSLWNGLQRALQVGHARMVADWLDKGLGFERFVVAVGQRPSEWYGLSRPRKDEPWGPGNLEWAFRPPRPRSSPVSPGREAKLRRKVREGFARDMGLDPQDLDRKRYPKLFTMWRNMCFRCQNPTHADYENYGGRGISVCYEWDGIYGYERFIAYVILNLGLPLKGFSIDRADVNQDYEPGNIRWATAKEQAGNRRKGELPAGWIGGRRAVEEAELKRAFLR